MSVYAPEDVFEAAPADAPCFVPSPVGEDAIHAFAGDPLSEVMRLILLESSRGEGKTSCGVIAHLVLADTLIRAGLAARLPYITAVVRDTHVNLQRALSVDALVLSPSGWVKSGDVSVGDFLVAANGHPTQVLGVYPQGTQPLWSVRFSDGVSVRVTGDHLWAVQGQWDREQPGPRNRRCPRQGWLPAPGGLRLATTDQLRVRVTTRKRGSRTWTIPVVEAVQFPSRPVPLAPYLLGVLLGDGGLSQQGVRLTMADLDLVRRVREVLPPGVSLRHVAGYDYRLTGGGRGHPNPVVDAVRHLGLSGLHSPEKFIPDQYLWNDAEVRLEVLRGLMDTDGSVSRDRHVSFSSTSERLADGVEFLVRSLGGLTQRRTQTFSPDNGHAHKGHWIGHRHPLVSLAIQLPPHIVPVWLPRKAVRLAGRRRKPYRWVRGVEPSGHGPAVCFRVANPSGLFVMQDFVVTHNTTIPTFRELQRMGLPLRIVGQGDEAIIEQDGLETNRFVFFGLDRPADADRLQGFTCGSLWIEEAAPAADFSGGVAPEALGIGATSVRQPGVPPRILLTQNPADDDHWTVHLEETLQQLGLADIEFLKFWMPPGGKAAHFRELAELAQDPAERERWLKSADAFDAYRRRSQALLEATGRQDLVQRLIKGEKGAVKMGEPVVPEFSRTLHVPKTPVRALPGLPLFRWWDLGGVHPAVAWAQPLAANGGVNVLGSRVGVNVGMADFILSEVRPFEATYGLQARREGDPFKRGWRGTYVVRDITDPTGNGVDARRVIQEMLKTRCEVGPERWAARRQALQTAFIRKGIGDRMWMQLDFQENKILIQGLGGRCYYPINPTTGRINGTLEAMKNASGIFSHPVDCLGYGLGKLFPAYKWLQRALETRAPRAEPAQSARSWLGH